MPTAFDGYEADFSGMSPLQLYISAVLHEWFIAVDEEGTEAAAATAVVMAESAAPAVTPFRLDRPFVFVIHDVETSTTLFVGRVADPSA
ncbi:MAG: serpin family protein [Nocardioidaceae bacterium]